MAIGNTTRSNFGGGPPVDEAPLEEFIRTLSQLRTDEWQKRIAAIEKLVNSIPDYSTSANAEDGDIGIAFPVTPSSASHHHYGNNSSSVIPWYRSSRSVRRLAPPLKNLMLDARSAVVKEATELIGTLMMVKLQPHPSSSDQGGDAASDDDANAATDMKLEKNNDNNSDAYNNGPKTPSKSKIKVPPPAFVGRLLFKDLLPSILQLSAQTVKVIRTYGVSMTLDMLPHCRVKSSLVILLDKMKSDKNRSVREDCARYLRCILETWPYSDPATNSDNGDESNNHTISRKEERLSIESARQIGTGLGRALSDPTQPVRNEAKRGFQALFRRFRSTWDEVMMAGVIRDVRLRKNLLEAASRSDNGNNNLFDDVASLDDMSLNSIGQGSHASVRSGASYRSYASRGVSVRSNNYGGRNGGGGGGGGGNAVPSVIGTPSKSRYGSSSASPSYLRGTAASSTRVSEREKLGSMPSPAKVVHDYSANVYVTTTGQVMATPSPRAKFHKPTPIGEDGEGAMTTTSQPFASLLRTPQHPHRSTSRKTNSNRQSPESPSWDSHYSRDYVQKSAKVLRKRLSCRITGIMPETNSEENWNQLSSINETEDNNAPQSTTKDGNGTEIANVATEVLHAHLSHLEEMEKAIATEKKLIMDLGKQFGILDMNGIKGSHFHGHLATLSEEQVCDYFESVHMCADQQRMTSENLLKEMEIISQGGSVEDNDGLGANPNNTAGKRELAQSPLVGEETANSNGRYGNANLETVQKDLRESF